MANLNLTVKWGKYAFVSDGYFAGNATERVSDFHAMLQDPSVKWIISNRGGYGCNTLLDLIDYDLVRNNPKGIQGYSDLTSLLQAVTQQTGLITFHGPMGIDDWIGNANSFYFQQVVMNAATPVMKNDPQFNNTYTIFGGTAKGRTIGGNLSLMVSILSSIYLSDSEFAGKILFLEDVGEDPYRIDRMLSSLQLAGYLDNLAGFVFGQCTNCVASNPSRSFTIKQILIRYIQPLMIPAFHGAQIGHISSQFTIPIGARVEIDANNFTITLLESAVN